MKLERLAPCKINLLLNVLGRRSDGFHELETVLLPLPLADRLTFELAEGPITLSCDHPELPVDASNLVHRAATEFCARARVTCGVRIHLEKRVPLAAGLGGGSSNAACTLLALNQLFGLPLAESTLHALAAALGSDVPFFLSEGPALGTGRGEQITALRPFEVLRGGHLLLIHPGFGVSTPWAYQHLSRHPAARDGQPGRALALIETLHRGDLASAARQFYNALEAPVFEKHPWLALVREFLEAQGALAARMSGSGSTTFALLERRDAAERLRAEVQARFGTNLWTAILEL